MTVNQLIRILLVRRGLMLALWLACVAAAVVAVLFIPKRYSATAQIFVNLSDNNNQANVQVSSAVTRNYILTQIETLKSQVTAQAVVEAEKLDRDPAWRNAFSSADRKDVDFKAVIAGYLSKQLDVTRLAASDLIAVSFSDKSPETAQHFANSFANTYVRQHAEISTSGGLDQTAWYDERLKGLRERLVNVETERSQLRLASVERGNTEAAGATDPAQSLPSQLSTARNAVIQAKAALQQVIAGQITISDGPELTQLRKQLADIDVGLTREVPLLGNTHRRVINLRANKEQLQQEIDRALARVREEQITAKQREVAAAEQRVVDLTGEITRAEQLRNRETASRAEGANLDREIDSLRMQIEALVQRRERAVIASSSSQSNVAVLSPATLPSEPSAPRIPLIIGLAAALGLVFGPIAALLVEMVDRRVRCMDDLTNYVSGMVIGKVSRVKLQQRMVPSTALSAARAVARRNRFFERQPDLPAISAVSFSG